mgnify:FL=1
MTTVLSKKWLLAGVFGAFALPLAAHAQQTDAPATAPAPAGPHAALVSKYCFGCHNDRLRTADMSLTGFDVEDPAAHPEIWEKVVRKLRARTMPPATVPKPDEATYNMLADFLESKLDAAAVAKPDPGRTVAAHRLNRAEYSNAIRDLLALDIDTASMLPSDDSGGFDNLGALLSVSPGLMERYLSAAGKISRLAVGDPSIKADIATDRKAHV